MDRKRTRKSTPKKVVLTAKSLTKVRGGGPDGKVKPTPQN